MAKSIHERFTSPSPDFIPEEDEHHFPASGGIFCDFIPEKSSAIEVRPVEPVEEVSTEPIPPHEPETPKKK